MANRFLNGQVDDMGTWRANLGTRPHRRPCCFEGSQSKSESHRTPRARRPHGRLSPKKANLLLLLPSFYCACKNKTYPCAFVRWRVRTGVIPPSAPLLPGNRHNNHDQHYPIRSGHPEQMGHPPALPNVHMHMRSSGQVFFAPDARDCARNFVLNPCDGRGVPSAVSSPASRSCDQPRALLCAAAQDASNVR